MRRHVQRRVIHRILVPARGFFALHLEDVVDLIFDLQKLGLREDVSDPASQGVEGVQRAFARCGVADTEEFPARREYRRDAAEHHRRQVDPVAVFIHEALRGAVVDGRRPAVQRKVGILIGAGRGDLSEDGFFVHKVGLQNPSALDAGALIDEEFNPHRCTGSYFEDFYDARIKTMHPSSRFGIFPVAPLEADDFLFLRYGLIEVYHWLITKRVHAPA
jgi:hypothetical protein